MTRPMTLVERVETPEGPLELRQRGDRDFMITIAGRVLMTSLLHRSELSVATLATARLGDRRAPRVLIGGLGLGYTLRAALDSLSPGAKVQVAELNPAVVRWCRGPLAALTRDALSDPRVEVIEGDVTAVIRAAGAAAGKRLDAIVLDLYVGPDNAPTSEGDPLYGTRAVAEAWAALSPGGVYSVWGEAKTPRFEARLERQGFASELVHNHAGGPRYAVYVATRSERSAEARTSVLRRPRR